MRSHQFDSARRVFFCVCVLALGGCGEDNPNLPIPTTDRVYVLGETIGFGLGGDAHRFRSTGWSQPEGAGSWTDGTAASLLFRLPAHEGALVLSATLSGHIKPPEFPAQPVQVYVKGTRIAEWEVGQTSTFTATIPNELIRGGGLVYVDFQIPRAISPQQLGFGADSRRLGIFCSDVSLRDAGAIQAARRYDFGSVIKFGQAGQAGGYHVRGWAPAEPEFTWTIGDSAALELHLPRVDQTLELRVRARGMTAPAVPSQPVDVYANGERVANWQVGPPSEFTASIPRQLLPDTGVLSLEFRMPRATSPKQVGSSPDPRVLGICVTELRLLLLANDG